MLQAHSPPPPPRCSSQVAIEGVEFEIVSLAKVLGVVISSDLKWSAHIDSITTQAAKRLYLFRQLKRAGIAQSVLVRFYSSVIRSILGVTNGKIRDSPRRRDSCLKIRDRDLGLLTTSEPETL